MNYDELQWIMMSYIKLYIMQYDEYVDMCVVFQETKHGRWTATKSWKHHPTNDSHDSPGRQSQPLSCIQFEKQFAQILGKDCELSTDGPLGYAENDHAQIICRLNS